MNFRSRTSPKLLQASKTLLEQQEIGGEAEPITKQDASDLNEPRIYAVDRRTGYYLIGGSKLQAKAHAQKKKVGAAASGVRDSTAANRVEKEAVVPVKDTGNPQKLAKFKRGEANDDSQGNTQESRYQVSSSQVETIARQFAGMNLDGATRAESDKKTVEQRLSRVQDCRKRVEHQTKLLNKSRKRLMEQQEHLQKRLDGLARSHSEADDELSSRPQTHHPPLNCDLSGP